MDLGDVRVSRAPGAVSLLDHVSNEVEVGDEVVELLGRYESIFADLPDLPAVSKSHL